MIKSVNIYEDAKAGVSRVSSRPETFAIALFMASLIGLAILPFTAYQDDLFAYVGIFFLLGLTGYYFVISIQVVTFEQKTQIKVRKGFRAWSIPLDAVTAAYTSYQERTSRQSLQKTHFLNVELQVNLPDKPKHWIRNGNANVFHYGFNHWGAEQEQIRKKFDRIFAEMGIPKLSPKKY